MVHAMFYMFSLTSTRGKSKAQNKYLPQPPIAVMDRQATALSVFKMYCGSFSHSHDVKVDEARY
jgi:hypothetical protein